MRKNKYLLLVKTGILFSLGITALLCLVSCRGKEECEKREVIPVRLDYDGRHANGIMLKLWEALEKKDREAVEELLSGEALSEIEDCDIKIDAMLSFFQGEVMECKNNMLASSKEACGGKIQYRLTGGYKITTTEETYLLRFGLVTKDDSGGDAKGVYRIDLITEGLAETFNGWGGSTPDICIYTDEAEEKEAENEIGGCGDDDKK